MKIRDRIKSRLSRPISTPRALYRITLVLIYLLVYGVLYLPLHFYWGNWVSLLILIPVAAFGWFFGFWAGLAGGFFAILFNLVMWSLNEGVAFNWQFGLWTLSNLVFYLLVGFLSGKLSLGTQGRWLYNLLKVGPSTLAFDLPVQEVVKALPDPAFVVDLADQVVACNLAMETFLGLPAKDLVGMSVDKIGQVLFDDPRPVLVVFTHRNAEKAVQVYPNLEVDGDALVAESFLPRLRPGGVYVWLRASLLLDSDGKPVGAVQIIRDMTGTQMAPKMPAASEEHDALTALLSETIFDYELARLEYSSSFPVSLVVVSLVTAGNHAPSKLTRREEDNLRQVAQAFQKSFRSVDLLARSGEREAAAVLPACDAKNALRAVKRLRKLLPERSEESYTIVSVTCQEQGGLLDTLKQVRQFTFPKHPVY